jgi:hypothetical protein
VFALTDYLGQDLLDERGERLGRVCDLAVRRDEPFPPVVALLAKVEGRTGRIAWEDVGTFEESQVSLRPGASDPSAPEDNPNELWLGRDVVDHQVVDLDEERIARVGEVELRREDSTLRVVAVDIGLATVLRRLGLRRLARRLHRQALPWDEIHLASGRGHQLQLRTPAAAVHRLTPGELMQLVGRLPVVRGAEVLQAVSPSDAPISETLGYEGALDDPVREAPLFYGSYALIRRVGCHGRTDPWYPAHTPAVPDPGSERDPAAPTDGVHVPHRARPPGPWALSRTAARRTSRSSQCSHWSRSVWLAWERSRRRAEPATIAAGPPLRHYFDGVISALRLRISADIARSASGEP